MPTEKLPVEARHPAVVFLDAATLPLAIVIMIGTTFTFKVMGACFKTDATFPEFDK